VSRHIDQDFFGARKDVWQGGRHSLQLFGVRGEAT
jgi:hypothetical protein